MAKGKKSTKKFMQKKNAGQQVFKKKPVRRTARGSDAGNNATDPSQQDVDVPSNIGELNMDEFLAGEFLDDITKDSETDDGSDGNSEGPNFDSEDEDFVQSSSDEDDIDGLENGQVHGLDDDQEDVSSSDDDIDLDGDEAADDGVRRQNSKLKDEISAHKAQLEKLRDADPEFYEYLAATDKELLAFGHGEEGDDDDEEEDEEEEEETEYTDGAEKAYTEAAPTTEKTITLALVDAWCRAVLEGSSLGAMRNLLKAYRVACHYGDTEEQVQEGMRLGSSAVYNKLMLFILKEADGVFLRLLDISSLPDGGESMKPGSIMKMPRWRKVEPVVKSYLGNTLHLLGQMTESSMLAFILRRMRPSIPFLAPYDKLQRRLLKVTLHLFGSSDPEPRVQAILLVRAMALRLPPPAMDAALKGVYRAYSMNAKFVNAASAPHIDFMAACVVEMYGLDSAAAYSHAFGFIRQLALLVRQALTAKSKDAYREVYCWQTINCLELWAKVLAAHADSSDLRPLIYPVAQLLLGAARLVPTPGYFPLRLRCARALNRLSQSTGVFVPLAPLVLEILQWSDLSRAPKPAPGEKAAEILLQLRVGKSAARSAVYQEEIVEQSLELLAEHLAQWGCHVAFPELANLPLATLRGFAKTTHVERFRKSARQLADAIERNIAYVGKARDQIEFAPKDVAQVGAFLSGERESGAAPVVQHAETLKERARARLAARSTQEITIGADSTGLEPMTKLAERSDSDGGDELPDPKSLMPPKPRKEVPNKASATKTEKDAKLKRKRQVNQVADDGGVEDVDDVVAPYELSDDDNDERARRGPLKEKRFRLGKQPTKYNGTKAVKKRK